MATATPIICSTTQRTRHSGVVHEQQCFCRRRLRSDLPAGWSLAGVADFDGDGNPDYVLFNPGTRQTAIWYFSGVTLVGGASGPTLPSGWALVAVGDFNGDCTLIMCFTTRARAEQRWWYMNNNVFVSGAYGPTLPAGWSLAGVADFDGDGLLDYLLFKPARVSLPSGICPERRFLAAPLAQPCPALGY